MISVLVSLLAFAEVKTTKRVYNKNMIFHYGGDNKLTTENIVTNPPPLTAADIAGMIDHSLLKPDATIEQVKLACETAKQWKTASVCVRHSDVSLAADILKGSKTVVSTVIGFPHGTTSTAGKLLRSDRLLKNIVARSIWC
jgi:hypothetical protein